MRLGRFRVSHQLQHLDLPRAPAGGSPASPSVASASTLLISKDAVLSVAGTQLILQVRGFFLPPKKKETGSWV